jgi:HNH endonuclease
MQAMPKAREVCLTAAEVRRLLRYDADTGTFFWRVDTKNTAAGDVAGSQQSRGYWHIKINRRLYLAHRLAWLYVTGEWPTANIDHINGKRSDNRFVNLRIATNSENARNSRRRINNACGYKGVHYKKRLNKFVAQIHIDGRVHHLGVFKTAEEAHAAYCKAAKKHFGEFARAA